MNTTQQKQTYQAPTVIEYGDVVAKTLGIPPGLGEPVTGKFGSDDL